MRRAATLLVLVACGGSPEPGNGLRPDVLVTIELDRVRLAIDRAELDREVHAAEALLKRDSDVSVTREVAKLVRGWNTVALSAGPLVDLWAVYADGTDVLAAGHGGWMARSHDGGASWQRIDPKFPPEGHDTWGPLIAELHGSGDHVLAIGFENQLVAMSDDRGTTWRSIALDLPSASTPGAQEPIEPGSACVVGRDAYLVAGTWPTKQNAIFVSHDFGATWKLAFHVDHLEDRDSLGSIAATRDGSEVYVGGSIKQRAVLYRSRDRGASWQQLAMPAQISAPGAIAVAGPGNIYTAFSAPDHGDTVTRPHALAHSRDGGATWTVVPVAFKGPPDEITGDDWWDVFGVFVAPDHTIYVSINGHATEQLEASRDGGKTWTLERSAAIKQIAFAGGAVYAAGHGAAIEIRKP